MSGTTVQGCNVLGNAQEIARLTTFYGAQLGNVCNISTIAGCFGYPVLCYGRWRPGRLCHTSELESIKTANLFGFWDLGRSGPFSWRLKLFGGVDWNVANTTNL